MVDAYQCRRPGVPIAAGGAHADQAATRLSGRSAIQPSERARVTRACSTLKVEAEAARPTQAHGRKRPRGSSRAARGLCALPAHGRHPNPIIRQRGQCAMAGQRSAASNRGRASGRAACQLRAIACQLRAIACQLRAIASQLNVHVAIAMPIATLPARAVGCACPAPHAGASVHTDAPIATPGSSQRSSRTRWRT